MTKTSTATIRTGSPVSNQERPIQPSGITTKACLVGEQPDTASQQMHVAVLHCCNA